jgi:hypothetical protein
LILASSPYPKTAVLWAGLTILSPELSAKRLEVLRDIIPGLSRVTALWDPTTGGREGWYPMGPDLRRYGVSLQS